jgi:hypothetical protein
MRLCSWADASNAGSRLKTASKHVIRPTCMDHAARPKPPLESEKGPPRPVTSRHAVIAWPDVGAGAIKGILTIDPSRDRPPAALIAPPIWLANDFDVHYVASGHDCAAWDQRHCGSTGSDKSDRQCIKDCSFQLRLPPAILLNVRSRYRAWLSSEASPHDGNDLPGQANVAEL